MSKGSPHISIVAIIIRVLFINNNNNGDSHIAVVCYFCRFITQRLNDKLLSCWIIPQVSGEVCCVHCNCMAGLGEAYSHIAAILYYLETLARIQGTKTCTQEECQWIMIVIIGRQQNTDYIQ